MSSLLSQSTLGHMSAVKRYRNPSMSQDGLTLVFFNGGRFHKEHRETVIGYLLVLLRDGLKAGIKVWTFHGAVLFVLSLDYFPSIEGIFSSGILVEPMIMNEKAGRLALAVFTANSVARRDIWPSREEAYKLLNSYVCMFDCLLQVCYFFYHCFLP